VPTKFRRTPMLTPLKPKIIVPFSFPNWTLNAQTVRIFNALYYWRGKRAPKQQIVDWDSYFYPLDALLGWNKIYGHRGFAQFQCVIPLHHAERGLIDLLEEISNAGTGSFLAVLKRFGTQSSNFSFPMEGYTLALDFPVNNKNLALMNKLDRITINYNGRFYLAKDSRMSRDVFHLSEQRMEAYKQYRKSAFDADKFVSAQSERLEL
jgi:decaprenylphospho-beta-D-ribofuranose 2-oxidase